MSGGSATFPPARRARARWVGRSIILPQYPNAPQYWRYLALTISMFGLQLVWSCEMSQASPYLLSLGLSKSMMAIVFLAGPLSGLIVQPVVGVLSDGCRSSMGRRRPFIIVGCIITSSGVLLLGWAKEVASIFTTTGGSAHSKVTIAFAILSVYVIDFSINVVQAMDRSLLVDVISPSLQPAANAWASRMFGFGAVFGYYVGGMDLVALTGGWLGQEQLKVLTFFTSFLLCVCHGITIACVQERVLVSRDDDSLHTSRSSATIESIGEIWTTLRTLPRPIQQVLNVQFASWIGWFPVLFFSTTWVAEIYAQTHWGSSNLAAAPLEIRDLATRAGTNAMLYHSIVSLATSIILPALVASSAGSDSGVISTYLRSGSPSASTPVNNSLSSRFARLRPRIPLPWLSLSLLWTFSNGAFAVLLLSTYFATTVAGASVIIAGTGFAWGVTNWAPFAILGDLILRIGRPLPIVLSNADSHWGPQILSPILEENGSKTPLKHSDYSDGEPKLVTPPNQSHSRFDDFRGTASPAMSDRSDAFFDSSMDTPRQPSSPRTPMQHSHPTSRERSPDRRRTSSHPYGNVEFPQNNSRGFVDPSDSTASLQDEYDPYASNSSLQSDTTIKVLKIRHSDSFELGDSSHARRYEGRDGLGLGSYLQNGSGGDGGEGDESTDWENEGESEDYEGGGGDQAGVILGCHNIYLVLPQFLVTALSSLVFALFAPTYSIVESAPASELLKRATVEAAASSGEWDALGIIFRIGGISAAVSAVMAYNMTRERDREHMRRLRSGGP